MSELLLTKPGLTAEQLASIESRGVDYLLSAGAGSGKTTVLVERFVRTHLEDGIPIESILAITFTEKAALEMRERISKRLRDLDVPEWARLANQAQIATIDGFCTRILREHCLHVSLPPDFAVLDEMAAVRLRLDAFEEALVLEEDAAVELLARYQLAGLRSMIFSAFDQLRTAGQRRPSLPDAGRNPDAAGAMIKFDRAVGAFLAALERVSKPGKTVAAAHAVASQAQEQLAAGGGELPSLAQLDLFRFSSHKAVEVLNGEAAATYLEALERLRQILIDLEAIPLVELLQPLFVAFRDSYERRKQERGRLDFADLELYVRDLLIANDSLREKISEGFGAIFVDEFQDTNPLQTELIELISRGNLFTVGDEFQSIYGFRHAEVANFRERRERLLQAECAGELTANFRSERELLDGINHTFSEVFSDSSHGEFLPLRAGRDDIASSDDPPIELLLVNAPEFDLGERVGGSTSRPSQQIEALTVANRIKQLAASGEFSYGDVAILLRTRSNMALFEDALSLMNIPSVVIGSGGFYETLEVSDVIAALSVIVNPLNELSLYQVLASPFVGASSDLLDAVARGKRSGETVWESAKGLSAADVGDGIGKQELQRLRNTLDLFERLRLGQLSLPMTVETLMAESGYELALLREPAGRRKAANIHKLGKLADQYQREFGRDLHGFADYLREARDEGSISARESLAQPSGGSGDSVKIMTVHQSKGLEFPVVFLSDLGSHRNRSQAALQVTAEGGIGLKLRTHEGGKGLDALQMAEIVSERKEAAQLEEHRLYYVAMTRAERKLILTAATRPSAPHGSELFSWIGSAVAPGLVQWADSGETSTAFEHTFEGSSTYVRCDLISPETFDVVVPAQQKTVRVDVEVEQPPTGAVEVSPTTNVSRLSYSAIEKFNRCQYRYYLEETLRLQGESERSQGGTSAADRGTVAHELLEQLSFSGEEKALNKEDQKVAELVGLVETFCDSAIYRRVAGAEQIEKELPFAFIASEVLIGGRIDLLAYEPDRTLIVDYKTDRRLPEDLEAYVADRYEVQRVVYALAALGAGAERVEVVHLFLERAEQPVGCVYGQSDRSKLEQKLEGWITEIQQGSFGVSDEPHIGLCAGCPGRYALCSWDSAVTGGSSPNSPSG